MSFILVGTNYKYSPVELREKISFSKRRLKEAILFLKERNILRGAVILSTCNRVEIYASVVDPKIGISEAEDFISRYHEIEKSRLSPYLYICEGKEAAGHLFKVACGLDSLILGETQILGQLKFSFQESEKAGFADEILRELFYSAVSLAGKIHRETKLSEGKVSVGSIAIDFIKDKVGALSGKNILIVGVGKVTELVLKYLKKEEPKVVFISNRTFGKAKEMAERIDAKAVRFDRLQEFLNKADILITATASPHFIIKKEVLDGFVNRKLLIIDLALPRDVDPQVKEMEEVDLFYLEDLDTVIKENIARKADEARKINRIIGIEAERLWRGITRLEQEPVHLH